ncbi:MAG: NADPH-dependent FMN reductase [Rhodanobacteraceae bacterium]
MTNQPIRLLGIAGSLRKDSYNRALLHAAQELAPSGMQIELFEGLGDIPLYNHDVEAAGAPEPVLRLKQAIANADGLLIATPEYNYSVPGVLKNAIDWASRPPKDTPLHDKPVGIVGASIGMGGTIRAQLALRQSFVFTRTPAFLTPEVLVTTAQNKFDANGKLTDEATRKVLADYLDKLQAWMRRQLASMKA